MKDNFEEMMKMFDNEDKIVISWKKGDPTSAAVEGVDYDDTEGSAKTAAAIFYAGAMLTAKAVGMAEKEGKQLALDINHYVGKHLVKIALEDLFNE